MSSNPPDPNELLKLLMRQQMLQRQQQQQTQPVAPPPMHTYNQAPAPLSNAGSANLLGNLVSDYLKAAPGTSAAPTPGPSSALLASLLASNNRMQLSSPAAVASGPSAAPAANQQQLLALSTLLSSISNPSSSSQPQNQHWPPPQQQQSTPQMQQNTNMAQLQQQQGVPPGQQPNIQAHLLSSHQQQNVQTQASFPPSSNQQGNRKSPLQVQKSNNSLVNEHGQNLPSLDKNVASLKAIGEYAVNSRKKKTPVANCMPPEPVSLLTLQTWNLEQLESHVRQLEECNQPVPNIVKILLEDARSREEKKRAKRISNRKSATVSRARKRQLIDELTADNKRLRRQALILSYLPDPVMAIDIDGTIKFCAIQAAKVLKHEVEDLEGASIEDVLVPESRSSIRRLIQSLVRAEQAAAAGEGIENRSDENSSQRISGESSSANVVSRSSDQSFDVLEVNVKDQDELGTEENVSDGSGARSKKNRDRKGERHDVSSNDEPPTKKGNTAKNEVAFSSVSKTNDSVVDMTVDGVMGDSVTANNAGANLSSLIHFPGKNKVKNNRKRPPEEMQKQDGEPHIHRKHILAPRSASAAAQNKDSQSSSSTDSDAKQRAGVNSSEDSGYLEDSNSNESSDDFAEDSSSLSENFLRKKGNWPRPLAPGCIVRLICKDLTTMYCELTSSIRTRSHNDEDTDLGVIDINPKPSEKGLEEPKAEKELLLCFRPILKGEKVGEDLRFPHNVSDSSNPNESGESEGKEVSDLDMGNNCSQSGSAKETTPKESVQTK